MSILLCIEIHTINDRTVASEHKISLEPSDNLSIEFEKEREIKINI